MSTIGIISFGPESYFGFSDLKSNLLYFDEIVYQLVETRKDAFLQDTHGIAATLREIELLEKSGLLRRAREQEITSIELEMVMNGNIQNMVGSLRLGSLEQTVRLNRPNVEGKVDFELFMLGMNILYSRYLAIVLGSDQRNEYVPIMPRLLGESYQGSDLKYHPVLSAVINNFPAISLQVPIEKLVELKKDNEAGLKLKRLRNWVGELTKMNLTEKEVSQNLDYLLAEYRNQLKLHKLEFSSSAIEVLTVAAGGALFGGVEIAAFAGLTTTLFKLSRKNVSLMQAEQKFTGREVAFIYHIQEKLC